MSVQLGKDASYILVPLNAYDPIVVHLGKFGEFAKDITFQKAYDPIVIHSGKEALYIFVPRNALEPILTTLGNDTTLNEVQPSNAKFPISLHNENSTCDNAEQN